MLEPKTKRTLSDLAGTLAAQSSGYHVRRLDAASPLDAFVGVEVPTGAPVFLMHVPHTELSHSILSLSFRGISVWARQLPDSPAGSVSVVLRLEDTHFLDEFCALVDNFHDVLKGVVTAGRGLRIVEARLRAFILFFSPENGPMDERRQRGLAGELQTLDLIITAGATRAAALNSWRGPNREERDFVLGPLLVEVKTTSSSGAERVRISSEHQLDVAADRALLLLVWSAVDDSAGQSIVERVATKRRDLSADPESLVRFEELLASAGFTDVQFQRGAPYRFQLAAPRAYRVDANFPRITPSSVPAGIARVAYDVLLSSCDTAQVPDAAMKNLLSDAIARMQ